MKQIGFVIGIVTIFCGSALLDAHKLEFGSSKLEAGNMMVITTKEYRSAVLPLIEWKNRKGIKTDLFIYPRDTGSTPDLIKSFIRKKYLSEEGLSYILIVGDAEDVPPARGFIAKAKGLPSDPVYALLTGNDVYPDVMIGRLSVENDMEARIVVNKNLWYEKNTDHWRGIILFFVNRIFT